jgi:hypothetical protein
MVLKIQSIVPVAFILVSLLVIPAAAYTIGNGGSAWSENSVLENVSLNLATNIIITNFIFQDDFETVLFNNRTNLTIPTYDGSGSAVHPDLYYNATGWNGYKYWMVMTPYPSSNDSFENPSIVTSNDGINWNTPTGLSNPIDPKPSPALSDYNSDPNLAFKDGTLYAFYREVNISHNILKFRTSKDGIHWSGEYTSLALPNHQLVSPAIIFNKTDNKFYMWYVDTGIDAVTTQVVLRNSIDGINWGTPQDIPIAIPNRIIWHINVEYIPEINEYWMVMSAGTPGSTDQNALFFAYSSDKLNWVLLPGQIIGLGRGWDSNLIYQSAIQYINGRARIWYSATSFSNTWGIGYAETSLDDLKKNDHWISKYSKKGFFGVSSSQFKNGQFSAKLDLTAMKLKVLM